MANDLDLSKLEAAAIASRDGVIRSDGWAGTVEMAELLRKDEAYMLAAAPEAVLALIARIRELEASAKADKGDADRWRFIAPKYTGFDFDWMPTEPDAGDGKSVMCFDMGPKFTFSVDAAGDIDAAIAASKKGGAEKP